MNYESLKLKVFLPYKVLFECTGVTEVIAETKEGSFGILPNRLDCVAALCPGILTFRSMDKAESFVAVDEGILVKKGDQVNVSVRNALVGEDLEELHKAVDQQFIDASEDEKSLKSALARLEVDFVRRYASIVKT